jgi:hypothetical protein
MKMMKKMRRHSPLKNNNKKMRAKTTSHQNNNKKKMLILGPLFLSAFFLYTNAQSAGGQTQQEPADGFIANGNINSDIVTATSTWSANGNWSMVVNDNELQSFTTNMIWINATSGHTHEFSGFEAEGEDIVLPPDKIVSITGTMDIGTNRVVTWEDVPAVINIGGGGKVISISVDHEATNHHFAGQAVRGLVSSITPCSDTPGASMEVSPTCPTPISSPDADEDEEEDEELDEEEEEEEEGG